MRELVSERRFEQDLKLLKRRNYKLEELFRIINVIQNEYPLPANIFNHKLNGIFRDCWECHIKSDWLLIYKKTSTAIVLIRTGTHSDLF